MENLTALKAELQLKQKELDIISEIDRIRDTMPEPTAMNSSPTYACYP